MMSHRKSYSHGSIPFSWEDKPGVCKTPNKGYPLNLGPSIKNSPSTLPPPPPLPKRMINLEIQDKKKIPMPPFLSQPPLRSTSGKGFRWQEDPFLVAYKECTKNVSGCKFVEKNKKGVIVGSNFSQRRSRSIFSCRGSCDVEDDSYLKLSYRLPRLPANRDRSTLADIRR